MSKKGVRNAAQMGELVRDRELYPDILLASSAVRACQTAEIVAEKSGYRGEIRFLDELFMAEADELIHVLRKLPDEFQRVMVIGHNPGLESLIPYFTKQVAALPTAGMAYLSLSVDSWKDLKKKTKAELVELWRPKDLETEDAPGPSS